MGVAPARHAVGSPFTESLVQMAPWVARMEPVVKVELERIEALELLGTTLAHLNDAEARIEMSPRIPLPTAIRDKLAVALRGGMAIPTPRCPRQPPPWTNTEALNRARPVPLRRSGPQCRTGRQGNGDPRRHDASCISSRRVDPPTRRRFRPRSKNRDGHRLL